MFDSILESKSKPLQPPTLSATPAPSSVQVGSLSASASPTSSSQQGQNVAGLVKPPPIPTEDQMQQIIDDRGVEYLFLGSPSGAPADLASAGSNPVLAVGKGPLCTLYKVTSTE